MLNKIQESWHQPLRPHLAQMVLWCLVYIAWRRSYQHLPVVESDPTQVATILSFLSPDILKSTVLFEVARWGVVAGGILWCLQLCTPWAGWVTAISFTIVISLYYENSAQIGHTFHLTALLLWIHAAWYHFRRSCIRRALRAGQFYQVRIYPGWVFQLSIFTIAIFHVYAGMSKLVVSGFAWPNGLSLQLWILLWGNDGITSHLLLSNRVLAQCLQLITLIVEVGAICAVISWRVRSIVGMALMGLYVGILSTFNYQFQYNALIVSLFLLPFYELSERLYAFMHARFGDSMPMNGSSRAVMMLRWLIVRVDIFAIVRTSGTSPQSRLNSAPHHTDP